MSESKRYPYKVWEPLLFSLVAVIGMIAGAKLVPDHDEKVKASLSKVNYSGRQVEEVIRFLESRYVNEVNSDSLVTNAINAVLKGLDPHTHYYPPSQKEDLDNKTNGSYVGIGVEVTFLGDTLAVLYPKSDSPAEKAGIEAGDKILQVNEHDLLDTTLTEDEKLDLIKGTKGSKINLKIAPMHKDTIYWKEVVREEIKVASIPVAYMIDSSLVYMKANRFTQTTYREFMDHWEKFATTKNAQHLILDLRDNPGGFLREAVNMLSQIIEEQGKLLVYTEGEHDKRQDYLSTGKIFYPIKNVVVLINENSASASEIIAGCLQDLDRGVIIGSRSFGKGLVQEQFNLSNGGTLRMTVSRYYTPSGRSIQKPYPGEESVDTSSIFLTAGKREVHGGGGIIPDISISEYVDWSNEVVVKWIDVFMEEALRYNPRPVARTINDIPEITQSIEPFDKALVRINKIMQLRFPDNMIPLQTYLETHKNQLEQIRKACFVTFQIGEEGWYHFFNPFDPVVIKAKEVVKMDPGMALNLTSVGK